MARRRSNGKKSPWLILGVILGLGIASTIGGNAPDIIKTPVQSTGTQAKSLSAENTVRSASREDGAADGKSLRIALPSPTSQILTPTSTAQAHTSAPKPTATLSPLTNDILEDIHGTEYARGSKGSTVKEIQLLLIAGGYLPDDGADGAYGKKTAAAVQQFQEEHALSPTGTATCATQYRLLEEAGERKPDSGDVVQFGNDVLGLVQWPDRSFFLGSFDSDGEYRQGTFYYESGEYYVGEYDDDVRSGRGSSYFPNGDIYSGEWANDRMEGEGVYHFGGEDSVERYEGEWANGMMHGSGVYVLADGTEIKGTWAYNQQIGW